ncbi:phosphohistidine phosphatase SixA [Idiomarina xiamenensis]|uniref:Phosphohistidine phosphatase SixA n=1 Tax=Idiomarina xiamenensis 10-D-4 TaxID=740709 RepID=K2K852_9GAMM|nr:phosphohistidine phosphatase SixA [Idiomarina xiamenensis]EKE82752.1 phosphohistidine phosphatase SixA [Idiomarina xiamenensis 10-D-4]
MKLYIMRHGEASAVAGASDADRRLTVAGEDEVDCQANVLRKALTSDATGSSTQAESLTELDCCYVSPLIRAQQTANIVLQSVPTSARVNDADVTPDSNADLFTEWLLIDLAARGAKTALVVSHMPFVSYLVRSLDSAQEPPIFSTAAIAEIELDVSTGRGRLLQMHSAAHCFS